MRTEYSGKEMQESKSKKPNYIFLIKKLEISYIIVNEKYWEEVYYRVYTSKSVMLMMIGYKEEQCQGIL